MSVEEIRWNEGRARGWRDVKDKQSGRGSVTAKTNVVEDKTVDKTDLQFNIQLRVAQVAHPIAEEEAAAAARRHKIRCQRISEAHREENIIWALL